MTMTKTASSARKPPSRIQPQRMFFIVLSSCTEHAERPGQRGASGWPALPGPRFLEKHCNAAPRDRGRQAFPVLSYDDVNGNVTGRDQEFRKRAFDPSAQKEPVL